jgi:nucleotide-binding universal stress UspA family protein
MYPRRGVLSVGTVNVLIGYTPGPRGDDALALGHTLAEALDAEPAVVTADRSPVAMELASIAADEEAAAIVVGSCHRGRLGRVVLGSVGTGLLHEARCAVAVAPAGLATAGDRRLLRVGVATDGSPEASAALEAAIGIAQRTRARLAIFAVIDSPAFGYGTSWTGATAAEIMESERSQKDKALADALGRVPPELPVESRLLAGSATSLLADASSDLDLLVMGSRGLGLIGRAILGGTAGRLIHSAACPVLVLPHGEGAGPFAVASGTRHGAAKPADPVR